MTLIKRMIQLIKIDCLGVIDDWENPQKLLRHHTQTMKNILNEAKGIMNDQEREISIIEKDLARLQSVLSKTNRQLKPLISLKVKQEDNQILLSNLQKKRLKLMSEKTLLKSCLEDKIGNLKQDQYQFNCCQQQFHSIATMVNSYATH